jgi:hypothetical protein
VSFEDRLWLTSCPIARAASVTCGRSLARRRPRTVLSAPPGPPAIAQVTREPILKLIMRVRTPSPAPSALAEVEGAFVPYSFPAA